MTSATLKRRHLSDLHHLFVPSHLAKDKRQEFKDINWKSKDLVAPLSCHGLGYLNSLKSSASSQNDVNLQSQILKMPQQSKVLYVCVSECVCITVLGFSVLFFFFGLTVLYYPDALGSAIIYY